MVRNPLTFPISITFPWKSSVILPSEITILPNRRKIHWFSASCVVCQEWVSPNMAGIGLTNLRLNYILFLSLLSRKYINVGNYDKFPDFTRPYHSESFLWKATIYFLLKIRYFLCVEGLMLGHLTLKIFQQAMRGITFNERWWWSHVLKANR
jgi:hypothetical protein